MIESCLFSDYLTRQEKDTILYGYLMNQVSDLFFLIIATVLGIMIGISIGKK